MKIPSVPSTPGPLARGGLPLAAPSMASKTEQDKLRDASRQLGGVFTEQLFKAMRETVPQGEGALDGGSGEEMFTGMLDQHLASDTRAEWAHGLGEAIYRRLRSPHADPAPAAHSAAGVTPSPTGASLDTAPLTSARAAARALAPLCAAPRAYPLGTGR